MSGLAIIIASYGEPRWSALARDRALPSTREQGAADIIIVHDDRGTLASTRNGAARATQATWLCFLDADDQLGHGYWTAISKAIGPHLLAGDALRGLYAPYVQYVSPTGHPQGSEHVPNAGRWPQMNTCVIGTVLHRTMFERVGGFREFPAYEDWDLWLRCERAGAFIEHVPDAVYRAHMGGGGRNTTGNLRGAYDAIWDDYKRWSP